MADAPGRLTRWTDPVLGELVWDDRDSIWVGRIEFEGRPVRIDLDPGVLDPSPTERVAVIGSAAALFPALRAAEPDLRQQASEEIADAVVEQQQEIDLPVADFAADLELQSISMGEGAALHYRIPRYFPGRTVTIFVGADASFGGVEVYIARGRA